jgi:hypothetical protein
VYCCSSYVDIIVVVVIMSSLVTDSTSEQIQQLNDTPNDEEEKNLSGVVSTFTSSTYTGRDSQEIRSRLLSRLGIYDAPPGMSTGSTTTSALTQPLTAAQHRRVRILRGMGVGYTMFQSPPDGSALRKPLNGVIPSKEPLKADHHDDDVEENHEEDLVATENSNTSSLTPTIAATATTTTKRKTTRIAFQDEVDVLPIPTRHEYSDRIKSRIWSNRHELQENAERNAVEFASEGWNWRTVTEDEGMYICSASGELVHPAWVGDLPKLEGGSPAQSSD